MIVTFCLETMGLCEFHEEARVEDKMLLEDGRREGDNAEITVALPCR